MVECRASPPWRDGRCVVTGLCPVLAGRSPATTQTPVESYFMDSFFLRLLELRQHVLCILVVCIPGQGFLVVLLCLFQISRLPVRLRKAVPNSVRVLLIVWCPAKQEPIRAGSHPAYRNHDHEPLSRQHTASNQAPSSGCKLVVSRRSSTECDLPKLQ